MNLTKKLGPLPAWAWALILGGGVGAYLLVHKSKGAGSATGETIPELAGQAQLGGEGAPSGGGGASVGSLEAGEAKNSEQLAELRAELGRLGAAQPVSQAGFGAGIGEVIEAREALQALGFTVGSPGSRPEPSSAGNSAVKKATGKGAAFSLSSARGKYRDTTFHGHAAHEYAHAIAGGVGPRKNIVPLGGPAKPGHGAAGSHLPHHVSKPPAHHTSPKPRTRTPSARPTPHPSAPHPAAHHTTTKPKPKPAKRKR